ncbi:MAG: hypothetical protein CVV64_12940 [Candidatus Wallbacteria bacterium HGW-Wallbacteria-1]|jgi:two-component system chemotaxis response regulator CheV|uniref:Chemotaxis protein CheV n=1 Tax=Candidatus Wallbacteria bacterium HGW-Wallbacteria-1 TaxID=2013854 RepID=A0A2N1PMZ4_9BACT|nr:MAG: hypothetical protein CVV64_12940 [Candidatus Wallbacteria bacterium HGW-Wallbacteria-1]
MSKDGRRNILFEAGASEVEIMEFILGSQSFGVNIVKVKQIVQYEAGNLSKMPGAPSEIMGLYMFRGNTIPLVDLAHALQIPLDEECEKPLVMVCEFNQMLAGFFIEGVRRIHQLPWREIKPMSGILASSSSCVLSSVKLGDGEMLILDLEFILAEAMPDQKEYYFEEVILDEVGEMDKKIKLIMVEDSGFIRHAMERAFKASGFSNAISFTNGKEAFEAIEEMVEKARSENRPLTDYFQILISDIEMPLMNGLMLCQKVREELEVRDIPVVIYSSLDNDQISMKCRQVGANALMIKPQMVDLIKVIKELLKIG